MTSAARRTWRRFRLALALVAMVAGLLASLVAIKMYIESRSLPTFEDLAFVPDGADAFALKQDALVEFVEANRGKVVKIRLWMNDLSPAFAMVSVARKGEMNKDVAFEKLETDLVAFQRCLDGWSACGYFVLIISGDSHDFHRSSNGWVLSGYFLIGQEVEMHQAEYFDLKSIPASDVVLRK